MSNFHTKLIIFDIFNQLKHIPSKALVAQWVHPLSLVPFCLRMANQLSTTISFFSISISSKFYQSYSEKSDDIHIEKKPVFFTIEMLSISVGLCISSNVSPRDMTFPPSLCSHCLPCNAKGTLLSNSFGDTDHR